MIYNFDSADLVGQLLADFGNFYTYVVLMVPSTTLDKRIKFRDCVFRLLDYKEINKNVKFFIFVFQIVEGSIRTPYMHKLSKSVEN